MKEYVLSLSPEELHKLFDVVRSVYDEYLDLECPNEYEQKMLCLFKSLVCKIAYCPYVKESSSRPA